MRWYDRRQGHTNLDTGKRTAVRLIPMTDPAPTIGVQSETRDVWVHDRPATTTTTDPRVSGPGHHDPAESNSQHKNSVRVTVEEAAILQSFPAGLPWDAAGSQTAAFRIIGNAVPPLLAKVILHALLNVEET